ncbi:hypothetical protein [Pseudaestuariivita rosea]|uniref:hypothetical protein n=1 Tax=Pseudaestuariivita rosea TaxID=2763263 RepID=UPI001F1C1D5F|nr:hypothetical protein [Pseudaestuariivita rosea]
MGLWSASFGKSPNFIIVDLFLPTFIGTSISCGINAGTLSIPYELQFHVRDHAKNGHDKPPQVTSGRHFRF